MLEGTTEYTTCSGLLTASSSTWPNTAVFQIAAAGVPLDKLVIGKPATIGSASNGYMDPTLLAQCVEDASKRGWSASDIPLPCQLGLTIISRCWRDGLGGKLSKFVWRILLTLLATLSFPTPQPPGFKK